MKIWITFISVFLLISCTSTPNQAPISQGSPSAVSQTKILKSTAGGITVSSYGKGRTREKAEKSMLRRAIKEVIPTMAGNVHNSPDLKKAITQWVNDQQTVDYEDMVKRWAFDIDTQQGNEYFLEGKVILNQAYLKSQVDRFLQQCRRTRRCGGRLSIYITPDATVPLSVDDIKLGREFMYSLQQQFIESGFEIKQANQQREAQYQLKLVQVSKEKVGLNLNAHFTVEALDNRAAGAVFATKKGLASSSIAIGGLKVAENRILNRAAKAVGANLIQQIIKYNAISEIIFYAEGNYSNDIEQQLANGLVNLYGITTDDIISAQNTTANGFTRWSFEVSASPRSANFNFKQGLMNLQQRILKADNPNTKDTKAGRKWSSYDGNKPPPEFKRALTKDYWSIQVEKLIELGKLDSPAGSANNAYEMVRAQPNHPNAQNLIQKISESFIKVAEKALDNNQIRQAKRYANRAKTIWPENPKNASLQSEIANTPVIIQAPLASQIYMPAKTQPNLKLGKQVLEEGKSWALLIGNQKYSAGVSSLNTPIADVRSLKKMLEKNYGFEKIIIVEDGTKDQIINALYRLQTIVQENDNLLIFYAGHGVQEKGFGGKGFWIPVDGIPPYAKSIEHLITWVPNSLVHDIIQASKAKHVLLISDSCFSGTFKMGTRGLGRQKVAIKNASVKVNDEMLGLASLTSRKAISSGDLEPVADGGGGGHSIFAYNLLKVLKERKAISAEQLFYKMKKSIAQSVSQHPQYFVIDSQHDEGGGFIFVPQ